MLALRPGSPLPSVAAKEAATCSARSRTGSSTGSARSLPTIRSNAASSSSVMRASVPAPSFPAVARSRAVVPCSAPRGGPARRSRIGFEPTYPPRRGGAPLSALRPGIGGDLNRSPSPRQRLGRPPPVRVRRLSGSLGDLPRVVGHGSRSSGGHRPAGPFLQCAGRSLTSLGRGETGPGARTGRPVGHEGAGRGVRRLPGALEVRRGQLDARGSGACTTG